MNWFRLYSEFATDPKVQMLPEVMQRRLVMLFCLECSNGIETFREAERETSLAFALRISEQELAETKALFIAKGFIDSQWVVLNWSKRQYSSDSSTLRVRAHRQRQKQAVQQEGELTKRSSNALEQSRTDTDEKPNPLSPPSPETPPSETLHDPPLAKPKRRARLPNPFNLTLAMREWAVERAPAVNLALETERFVNYYRGNGKTMADWCATWRNWMLKAQDGLDRRATGPPANRHTSPDFNDTSWAEEPIL